MDSRTPVTAALVRNNYNIQHCTAHLAVAAAARKKECFRHKQAKMCSLTTAESTC